MLFLRSLNRGLCLGALLCFTQLSFAQLTDTLNVNNINALISQRGFLFGNPSTSLHGFEVPAGTGIHAFLASNLWIGGQDGQGAVYTAVNKYGNGTSNMDFQAGPLTVGTAGTTAGVVSQYERIWKVTRAQVIDHIANWNQGGYTIPTDILEWPAHGDSAAGYAPDLAPFVDTDNDGVYDPAAGDYPDIRGDMTLFQIYNDGGVHFESGSNAMGVEIHLMVFAFDAPGDSVLNNSVFTNYKIYNRSSTNYSQCYFGNWSDMDLGNYDDDFIASDVDLSTYYVYNGDSDDEDNGPVLGYGMNAAVIAVVTLGGPHQDADNTDNAFGIGAGQSTNGMGYGDGTIDNERLGMTSFVYYDPWGSAAVSDPSTAVDYYNYLQATWKDGTQMVYGGNGHLSDPNADPNTNANYMHPGLSDTYGYGTGGVVQGNWDEVTAGNPPSDRRGVASSGPVGLDAGGMVCLDYGILFTRDYTGSGRPAAIAGMQNGVVDLLDRFENDSFPDQLSPVGVEEVSGMLAISCYPNPTNGLLFVKSEVAQADYVMVDLFGKYVRSGRLVAGVNQLDLFDLAAGIYMLNITAGTSQTTIKVVR